MPPYVTAQLTRLMFERLKNRREFAVHTSIESTYTMAMNLVSKAIIVAISVTLSVVSTNKAVFAAAVRTGLFSGNTLPANDDGSSGLTGIGFNANFFGTSYSQLYVNNNGNVTFGSPSGAYTPTAITGSTANPIIAPFFADVDTRGAGNTPVTYGSGVVNGRNAFGVNWVNVGYFESRTDKLNSFQLVMIDRSDVGVGDFDIEFNYDRILWETGSASGGTNGFGGSSARVGYSNGAGNFLELPGSGVNGAFLNGGPNQLITQQLNSGVDGRFIFSARNGGVSAAPDPTIPTPALIPGIVGMGMGVWRKRKKAEAAS
jgi:Nidogen-like